MRDIFKIAEETTANINGYYDLSVCEIVALLDTMPFLREIYGAPDKAINALIIAFKYGYAMGTRAERNRAKRAKQTKKQAK